MRVGFIGLGNMGVAMAATLIKAGHELTVYNRTPAKAEALVDQGARYAQTVADACRGEVVITMLSDDNALENVVFGENGIATVLSPGAIHISSSTVSVALADKLTATHSASGQKVIACPGSGRPEAAATGKWFMAVAGAENAVDACMPIFNATGQRTSA